MKRQLEEVEEEDDEGDEEEGEDEEGEEGEEDKDSDLDEVSIPHRPCSSFSFILLSCPYTHNQRSCVKTKPHPDAHRRRGS